MRLVLVLALVLVAFPSRAEIGTLREQTEALREPDVSYRTPGVPEDIPLYHRKAPRARGAYTGAVVMDLAMTCYALGTGNAEEFNPFLGGADADCETIVFLNAMLFGLLIHLDNSDPRSQTYATITGKRSRRKFWRRSAALRFVVVSFNAYQFTKL